MAARVVRWFAAYMLVLEAVACAHANHAPEASAEAQARLVSESTRAFPDKLVESLPPLLEAAGIPGAAVAVVSGGEAPWARGFGVAQRDGGGGATASTVFEAASLSKPVVAYIALRLADRGLIDLDKPLHEYLIYEELRSDARSERITARMVLSHTSGLQNELVGDAVPALAFEPGEAFKYSGLGFSYLQRVLERVTGAPLEELARREVFKPLSMTRSSFVWREDLASETAIGHDDYGVALKQTRPPAARAPSSLHTTAEDYARFVRALMRREGLGRRLGDEMASPQIDVAPAIAWGLGWAIEEGSLGRAIWHWGDNSNTGFTAYVIAYPRSRDAFVYFSNSRGGLSIIGDVLGLLGGSHPGVAYMGYERYDAPDRVLRLSIARRIAEDGVDAGLRLYDEAKAARSDGRVSEQVLNGVGYHLLRIGRPVEAVRVMEKNVAEYPQSWNAHDSLAEACEAAGKYDLAREHYARSLALNPDNSNARDALKRLGT